MNKREYFNLVTGLISFITWLILSYKNSEYTINIALANLLILLGFGGRDTIIDIIKIWKNSNINK